jgi:glycosyltransferase involved in cell wall biosynthesis
MDKQFINNNKSIHVMQIVGDPVGGIRKHVHSILLNMDSTQIKQSYAFSSINGDSTFHQEISLLEERLNGAIIPLIIKKKPNYMDIVNIIKLVRHVKKTNVDIIHGHGAKGGLYARLTAKICGIKAIYTPHGGSVHNMFSPLADKVYILIEKWLYNMTDYFVFESQYTEKMYYTRVGCSSEHAVVNYNGIDPINIDDIKAQTEKLGYMLPPHDIPHIGVVGMLRPQKGQIYAIYAAKELINKGNIVYLHFFGDGPDRKMLMQLTKTLEIEERVFFHGDVDDVMPHMYAMDLILIPSLFESFGYVAVEAMALEKHIIASNVGGLKETINTKCGDILVSPANVNEISNAIIDICLKKEYDDSFRENSRKIVKNFQTENMINKLTNIYRTL